MILPGKIFIKDAEKLLCISSCIPIPSHLSYSAQQDTTNNKALLSNRVPNILALRMTNESSRWLPMFDVKKDFKNHNRQMYYASAVAEISHLNKNINNIGSQSNIERLFIGACEFAISGKSSESVFHDFYCQNIKKLLNDLKEIYCTEFVRQDKKMSFMDIICHLTHKVMGMTESGNNVAVNLMLLSEAIDKPPSSKLVIKQSASLGLW